MKVLVLGSGAREHSIAWKLKQSNHDIFLHPGNAGTIKLGFCNLGQVSDKEQIALEAKRKNIETIIIGPEALLAQDYASYFRKMGFLVLGPGKEGAQLETSKIFAKQFMVRAGVPTAQYAIHSSLQDFKRDIDIRPFPKVLKLDGLAAGKGVVIAKDSAHALIFAEQVWNQNIFGKGHHQVIEEEFISGVELSYLGLCDGTSFIPLSSSTDFKRVFDHDKGPNTGGMGAISPSPHLNAELEARIKKTIVKPILEALEREKLEFHGVLYIGIMISPEGNPYVLEFNTRFGDPETQSLMMRIESDLLPALVATAKGKLNSTPPLAWKKETAIYVVAASPGYPEKPELGEPISGIDSQTEETELFFAGVELKNNKLHTSGGRVLGVGALGRDASEARKKAYFRLQKISWPGIHFRTDIGIT